MESPFKTTGSCTLPSIEKSRANLAPYYAVLLSLTTSKRLLPWLCGGSSRLPCGVSLARRTKQVSRLITAASEPWSKHSTPWSSTLSWYESSAFITEGLALVSDTGNMERQGPLTSCCQILSIRAPAGIPASGLLCSVSAESPAGLDCRANHAIRGGKMYLVRLLLGPSSYCDNSASKRNDDPMLVFLSAHEAPAPSVQNVSRSQFLTAEQGNSSTYGQETLSSTGRHCEVA